MQQDSQGLLKTKYCCPWAMPVQHFINQGQLVQELSCTEKHAKKPTWCWPLAYDLDIQ